MKFKVKQSKDDQFYFIVVAANGRTILQSETYKAKFKCMQTLTRLNSKFKMSLKIIDETIKIK